MLPREAVDAPFLEVSKTRLDGGLSNLVPVHSRGVGTRSLRSLPTQAVLRFYENANKTKQSKSRQNQNSNRG